MFLYSTVNRKLNNISLILCFRLKIKINNKEIVKRRRLKKRVITRNFFVFNLVECFYLIFLATV